ncbi:MAG: hypothetical protein O3A19_12750 [Planctomycetota bacterium]|nr:hypothetical protein [Planctomycetota bacterium]MDA1027280.1 hypothetical protein [Planctomycetota bacterium]
MFNHVLLASLLLVPSMSAIAGDGGAILKIANVNATRGQTVVVPVGTETMDLIGGFGFNAMPVGLTVEDVIYNGPIFSNGWEGWDNAPSDNARVDAACNLHRGSSRSGRSSARRTADRGSGFS